MLVTPEGFEYAAPGAMSHRRGHLALAFQETLTATVRLRANRAVGADVVSFRNHLKGLLSNAHQEARRAGYGSEDVKLAAFAVIAFVDESVLNCPHPMFGDWHRKPLQEEVFGGHTGGEVFFQNLQDLLRRQDSEDAADLLEVHQLCLLLGFRGRYAGGGNGDVTGFISSASAKIARVRGRDSRLAPDGALPTGEALPRAKDPWLLRLGYVAVAAAALAIVLFVIYRLVLHPGIEELSDLARIPYR
jgi:type VI secretion system protein ImpK